MLERGVVSCRFTARSQETGREMDAREGRFRNTPAMPALSATSGDETAHPELLQGRHRQDVQGGTMGASHGTHRGPVANCGPGHVPPHGLSVS